jgi:hypothetical protein
MESTNNKKKNNNNIKKKAWLKFNPQTSYPGRGV